MEIILLAILLTAFGGILWELGYARREYEFQGSSVTFTVSHYPVVRIEHKSGKVDVTVYDEKFVNIIR